ncbi:MAG: DNA repair protein RecO [Candidatus Methylomirabilales bacterium]
MLYKDQAVVLRTMRLGEADRIVTFFGRAGGKIRAVAKGVRKTKSRFGGRLEPFCHLSLVLWRGRSELDTVTQAEVLEPFRPLREDLNRFVLGQVMLEAVDRAVEERQSSPRIFTLLADGLHELASRGSPLVLARFLLRLSALAGFAPSLAGCVECGAAAAAAPWFSPGQGGAVCLRCRAADAEEVGTEALELMHSLSKATAEGWADPRLTEAVLRLARSYTEYHLERRLKAAVAAEMLVGSAR